MINPPTFSGDLAPLFAALAKAQAEIDPAIKRARNPHFKSRYADLTSVLDAILPSLNKYELALLQLVGETNDGAVTLTTVLTHSSGAMISAFASCPLGRGGGPQGAGSGLSYLRRYAAQALIGLPTIDDDGNYAQKPKAQAKTPSAPKVAKLKAKTAELNDEAKARKDFRAARSKIKELNDTAISEKHPSFEPNRIEFMKSLKNINWKYPVVVHLCESLKKPRPSMMDQETRNNLLTYLSKRTEKERIGWLRTFAQVE